MSEFEALLKRSFAEAPEPAADDGFVVQVGHAVARRERWLKLRQQAHGLALALGGAAVLYGGYAVLAASGPQFIATAGLQLAEANGAISAAPSLQTVLQSFGAGLSQILLVTAALVGGAVAYRSTQE